MKGFGLDRSMKYFLVFEPPLLHSALISTLKLLIFQLFFHFFIFPTPITNPSTHLESILVIAISARFQIIRIRFFTLTSYIPHC